MDDMFHLAVEACPAAMLMVGRDGTIELVNAECERMFGYGRDQLVGSSIDKLVPSRARDGHHALRAGFFSAPSKRLMGVGRDLHAVRGDGSEFPVEIGLTPVAGPSGLGVLAFVIDITARRAAEKSIRAYTEELERANEGLARFAYAASHDIQEPLRKIVAFAEVMKTALRENNPADVGYAVNVMQASARHARTLVADLLSFARSSHDEYTPEPTSAREIVDRALLALSQILLDEQSVLEVMVEDFRIEADRTQLTLLVQNLVSNALKYHKPGERPVVRIVADTGPDGSRRLAIEDEGIGFPPAHANEIFEPFKRLHSRDKYPGSGIGLAICKTIAARHGWTISASSTPMVGSRFEIGFGAADDPRGRRAIKTSMREYNEAVVNIAGSWGASGRKPIGEA